MTLITVIVIGTVSGTKTGLWTALLVTLIILLLLIIAVFVIKIITRNKDKTEKIDKAILGGHFVNFVLWLCAFIITCISFAKGGLVVDGIVMEENFNGPNQYPAYDAIMNPQDIPCDQMTPSLTICQDRPDECEMRFRECIEIQNAGLGGASGGSVAALVC